MYIYHTTVDLSALNLSPMLIHASDSLLQPSTHNYDNLRKEMGKRKVLLVGYKELSNFVTTERSTPWGKPLTAKDKEQALIQITNFSREPQRNMH